MKRAILIILCMMSVILASCADRSLMRRYAKATYKKTEESSKYAKMSAFVLSLRKDSLERVLLQPPSEDQQVFITSEDQMVLTKRVVFSVQKLDEAIEPKILGRSKQCKKPPCLVNSADRIDHLEISLWPVCSKLTEQSFESLRNEPLPNKILEDLERLKDKEFPTEENELERLKDKEFPTEENELLDAIKELIGKEQADKYKGLIVKHAISCNLPSADFVSWDKFSTEYETIDMSSISLSKVTSFEIGLGVSPKEGERNPIEGGFKYSDSRDLTEEVSLRQRYVLVSGMLGKRKITISQQSVVGIDLAGNSAIDLQIKLSSPIKRTSVLKLSSLRKDENDEPKDPSSVEISYSDIIHLEKSDPVIYYIGGRYRLRHVLSKDKTIIEGDDKVIFISGDFMRDTIELFTRSDLQVFAWGIGLENKSPNIENLSIKGIGEVMFASPKEAYDFVKWLKDGQAQRQDVEEIKVAGHCLMKGTKNLTKSDIWNLVVKERSLN